MESIKLKARTGTDGTLIVSVRTPLPTTDLDVTVEYEPVSAAKATQDKNGWPAGYFDRTAGSLPDLERGEQGEYDNREVSEW